MEQELAAQLIKAAQIVEEKLDEHISQLDHIKKTSDDTDLEEMRRKRLIELKKAQAWRQELASNGHGRLEEVASEAEFFAASKKSDRMVCHFYDSTNRVSSIVDKALEKIAAKYFGTRLIKANSDRVPFLIKRLNIRRLPTLAVVIDGKVVDYIRVVDEFGAEIERNGLAVEALEARLGRASVIDYRAPPPVEAKPGAAKVRGALKKPMKSSIRGRDFSDDSDDSADWN